MRIEKVVLPFVRLISLQFCFFLHLCTANHSFVPSRIDPEAAEKREWALESRASLCSLIFLAWATFSALLAGD